MRDAYIAGTGSFLPANRMDNKRLYTKISNFDKDRAVLSLSKKGKIVEGKGEDEIFDMWVQQVCGITSRSYIEEGMFPLNHEIENMAVKACQEAIAEADIDKNEIDCIIFGTYTAQTLIPNSACTLSYLLDIENCAGVTINTACSGFIDAIGDALSRIQSEQYNTILVVSSEFTSSKVDYNDPSTAILFGDGAAACVVKSGKKGIHSYYSGMKFSNEHITMIYGKDLRMDGGPLVQKKAVNAMYNAANVALERSGFKLEDIDYVIPHQANLRIMQSLKDKLKVEDSKYVNVIANIGNISCATIPVALNMLRKNKIKDFPYKENSKILLTAVGGGYTFGSVLLEF